MGKLQNFHHALSYKINHGVSRTLHIVENQQENMYIYVCVYTCMVWYGIRGGTYVYRTKSIILLFRLPDNWIFGHFSLEYRNYTVKQITNEIELFAWGEKIVVQPKQQRWKIGRHHYGILLLHSISIGINFLLFSWIFFLVLFNFCWNWIK